MEVVVPYRHGHLLDDKSTAVSIFGVQFHPEDGVFLGNVCILLQ
jgi:anthranilate/para-aminobenzoate synthase component II